MKQTGLKKAKINVNPSIFQAIILETDEKYEKVLH